MNILNFFQIVKPSKYTLYTYVSLHIGFLLTCFKNIMFNEKNKLKKTNNHITKMLDMLKHTDY